MDLREYCENLGFEYMYNHKLPLRYEDDLIAIFGYGQVSVKNNPNLSLCDNLDYKNDVKQLILDDGYGVLYKLTGEHLDQIRGKLIQIPRMFDWDTNRDVIIARMDEIEKDCIIGMLTRNAPLVIWFKNCKFTKVEDTKR